MSHLDCDPPVSLELLDSYHNRRLSSAEENQVRQHLVSCRDCQRLLLDWVDFMESDRQESRLWSAELMAVWEEWGGRLGETPLSRSDRPPSCPPPCSNPPPPRGEGRSDSSEWIRLS